MPTNSLGSSDVAMMDGAQEKELHVVMVPWLAFGHLIPFHELSKSLAFKGVKVTFFSTQRNINRLPRIPPQLAARIDLPDFRLPQVDGLPAEAEATVDLEPAAVPYLKKAYDMLGEPFKKLIESISPDWIVYDFAAHWVPPIAAELGIPCAYYSIFGAAFSSFFGARFAEFPEIDNRWTPERLIMTPDSFDFPSLVKYKLHEAISLCNGLGWNASGVADEVRLALSMERCRCILIRSCKEFESEYLDVLERLNGKPVLPVGLLPTDESIWDHNACGPLWSECSEWLDAQEPKSVVFVAFGTESRLTKEQIHELAFGLELSNLPFLWALRVAQGDDAEGSLPKGFRDRTTSRGLVFTTWVPQVKILAHPAVGGVLQHAGLSSTVESLQFGLPLALLPMVYDQGLNARLLAEKKVGVELERDEKDGKFTRFDVAKSLRLIMVEEEGQSLRAKAKEMESVFGSKELNDGYVSRLVQWLQVHKAE